MTKIFKLVIDSKFKIYNSKFNQHGSEGIYCHS